MQTFNFCYRGSKTCLSVKISVVYGIYFIIYIYVLDYITDSICVLKSSRANSRVDVELKSNISEISSVSDIRADVDSI
jgi:hypothetical protein